MQEEEIESIYGMAVLICKIRENFWRKNCFCLLKKIETIELEYTFSPSKAVVQFKRELDRLSEKYKFDCLWSLKDGMDVVLLSPFMIRIHIEMSYRHFFVFVPKLGRKIFSFFEWRRALAWIQGYLEINIEPLQEAVERAYEKFYLNPRLDVIARTSIRSSCVSYIKENGRIFKLVPFPLRSEIYIRTSTDLFELNVFHKPFSENPDILTEILNNPYEVEIENYLTCEKIFDAWES